MRTLKEENYLELKNSWAKTDVVVTLVYTSTCGTCQLAKKMLEVVQETLPTVAFRQINLNFNESLALDYEILSIPCLLIHYDHSIVNKSYKFQSVPYLYEKINSYI